MRRAQVAQQCWQLACTDVMVMIVVMTTMQKQERLLKAQAGLLVGETCV
jgi:hypothetical protein